MKDDYRMSERKEERGKRKEERGEKKEEIGLCQCYGDAQYAARQPARGAFIYA